MSRSIWLSLFLWCLSAGLAGWVMRDISWSTLGMAFSRVSMPQALAWGGLNLLVMALSTLRWQVLLHALSGQVSFLALLAVRLAGQTISFITPGPQFGGEPLQVFWLAKGQDLALHKAIVSLGLDRICELWVNLAVLVMGVLIILSFGMPMDEWFQRLIILSIPVILIPGLVIRALRDPRSGLERLKRLSERWLRHPRLRASPHLWDTVESDLLTLRTQHGRLVPASLLLSLLGWGMILAELALLLAVAGVPLTVSSFALVAVSIRLAMLMPLPGGIGTIEAAVLWSFHWLALPVESALILIALMRTRDLAILLCGAGALGSLRHLR